jgi:hypothetical protein
MGAIRKSLQLRWRIALLLLLLIWWLVWWLYPRFYCAISTKQTVEREEVEGIACKCGPIDTGQVGVHNNDYCKGMETAGMAGNHGD